MENRREDCDVNVAAEQGEVEIDAPGIVASMSPECAAEAADKLLDGARDAFGQRAMKAVRDRQH